MSEKTPALSAGENKSPDDPNSTLGSLSLSKHPTTSKGTTAVTPGSPADPAEAKIRIIKSFQRAQLFLGKTPNEAMAFAVKEVKSGAPAPLLFQGQVIAEEKARVNAVLESDAGINLQFPEWRWEQLGALFSDFFYANQLIKPAGENATETDPCVDLATLRKLYDRIEQGVNKKEEHEMSDVGDGAASKRTPAEIVSRHLGDLCTAMSKLPVKANGSSAGGSSSSTAASASSSAVGSSKSSSPVQQPPVNLDGASAAFGAGAGSSSSSSSSTSKIGAAPAAAGAVAAASSSSPADTGSSLEDPLSQPGGLRILFMVLFHPGISDPDRSQETHRFLRGFRALPEGGKKVLAQWLSTLPIAELRRLLDTLQQYLSITFLESYHESGTLDDHEHGLYQEHEFDMFVARTSQLCKNALIAMDLIWRANSYRLARRRAYRKEELVKGTAAMLRSASKEIKNGARTDGGEPSTPSLAIDVLKFDEFRNDALVDVDAVLRHDYNYTLYYDHLTTDENDRTVARKIPKTLQEIVDRSAANTYTFGLLEYNFCLDATAKCRLLKMNTMDQQRQEHRREIMSQMFQVPRNRINPYLVLKVRRDNLIQDTLQRLSALPPSSYRKSLKVVFEGEQGVDEGGVRKEFFQLLLEQLYDPSFAMFNYNPDNKTFWFNLGSFETNLQYEMFGALLGIAIYNDIVDIRFPMVVYEKLLAPDIAGTANFSVDDLLDVSPDTARGLLQLLEFDGNVEETYCRDFVATYESFGAQVEVPLKFNGEKIPVTNENRTEFVELYVDWFFNKSIYDKFKSFKKGFLRCMQPDNDNTGRAICDASGQNFFLSLFRPGELEVLICGSETLDFEALKQNTEYQDGFDKESPTVSWFWEVVLQDLVEEDKRSLLAFCTGSSRAPPKGLGAPEAKLTIGRQGPDSEALPTAHTCFNHLLIPEYADKDKLRKKLKLAVANNQGFGLI